MKDKITINSDALTPIPDFFETQIILQRHCSYDKANGNLLDDSKAYQERIVLQFLHDLEKQNLDSIYY